MVKSVTPTPSNAYFTSDLHFGHYAAARWRGFDGDVDAMDEVLIKRWNEVIHPGGLVYCLGDLSFRPPEDTEKILARLNGQINLIAGNHDDDNLHLKGLHTVRDIRYIRTTLQDGTRQKIMLCHYPMVTWRSSHYGAWMLHGHCHGQLDTGRLPEAKRMDVGADTNGLYPYRLEDVAFVMGVLQFEQVDNHAWKGD